MKADAATPVRELIPGTDYDPNTGEVFGPAVELVPAGGVALTDPAHMALSDGRPWDGERVVREIQGFTEQIVYAVYQVGKRLLWAKEVLGHGRFESWCEAHLPFSKMTRSNYMRIASFLVGHPKLMEPCGQARLKNVLLLTSLPRELQSELADGNLPEVPLEELGTIPYAQLKAALEREKNRREKLEVTNAELETKLTRTEKALGATIARERSDADGAAIEQAQILHERFDRLWADIGLELDKLARRAEDLAPEAAAEVRGLVAYIETRTEHEVARFNALSGGDVADHEFDEIASRPRPLASHYPIPEARELPRQDEAPAHAAGTAGVGSTAEMPSTADIARHVPRAEPSQTPDKRAIELYRQGFSIHVIVYATNSRPSAVTKLLNGAGLGPSRDRDVGYFHGPLLDLVAALKAKSAPDAALRQAFGFTTAELSAVHDRNSALAARW